MRRRTTAHRETVREESPVTPRDDRGLDRAGPVGTTGTNPPDEVGNVRRSGMAEQGVGGPVPAENEGRQRPTMTDLGSDSDASSEEEEEEGEDVEQSSTDDSDEDSDSEDDTDDSNAGVGSRQVALPNVPMNQLMPARDPNLSNDGSRGVGGAVVSAAGAGVPMQQATHVSTYGNITVKNSKGLHFGPKTEYHGTVIIEQHLYGDQMTVKQLDDNLQLKFGATPLAITDGSDLGVQKRTGLEVNSGSFRIGSTSAAVAKGGSGFLWRHLLGGRPRSSTWVAWVALCLGCMAILAVTLTVTLLSGAHKRTPSATTDTGDIESEELSNGYKTPPKQQNRTILSRRRLVVVPRREWVAQPPKSTTLLKHPVEYVVISHTATDPCTTQAECTLTIRYIQVFHVEGKKWLDIGYNFLVAGDGQAYEGRGWDVVGAHTTAGFNGISVGIAFVGTFDSVLPPPVQVRACKLLIEEGVKLGKISPNYKLIADRQVSSSESPGKKLFEDLQTWDHWTAIV